MSNQPSGESAPFNMAIATLMRLDGVLLDLKKISMAIALADDDMDKASSLSIKISLAKQFYIYATPLIPESKKVGVKDKMNELKVPKGFKSTNDPVRPQRYIVEFYSKDMDDMIDNFVIEVSEILQREGYFMPSARDAKYALRRD